MWQATVTLVAIRSAGDGGAKMTTDAKGEQACLHAALAGDSTAMRKLVELLAPVIQARVAKVLIRRLNVRGPRLRTELEDLTQEAFVELLAHGGRALRGWDPCGGRSLQNYVGRRVEWFVASQLRGAVPLQDAQIDLAKETPSEFEHRDSVQRLLAKIETKWSEYGLRLFYLLFVLQQPSKEVGAELGLSCAAVDQWRFRLREYARNVLPEE